MKLLSVFILIALCITCTTTVGALNTCAIPIISDKQPDIPANEPAQSLPDIKSILVPQLKYDLEMQPILITHELKLTPNSNERQNYNEIPEGNTPYGSIIEHSNGKTTVFDSTGKQIFTTLDSTAPIISSPGGDLPATLSYEVPSGSSVIENENGNTTYIFYNNKLILTIIQNNSQNLQKPQNKTLPIEDPLTNPKARSMLIPTVKGWLANAETSLDPSFHITYLETTWNAPTVTPTDLGVVGDGNAGGIIAIFNGLQKSSDSTLGIMQPVLSYNGGHIGNNANYPPECKAAYCGAAWDYHNVDSTVLSTIHSTPMVVSPGNNVKGTVRYNSASGSWRITFANMATGTSTYFDTNRFPKEGKLTAYVALEATGYGIKQIPESLPGAIKFWDFDISGTKKEGALTPIATPHVSPNITTNLPNVKVTSKAPCWLMSKTNIIIIETGR